MSSLEELFCDIDDFCTYFEAKWRSQLLGHGVTIRKRARSLYLSEIMTILVAFHLSWCAFLSCGNRSRVAPQNHYRNFKHYYIDCVSVYWRDAFPKLPSYQRFVEWIPSTLLPLCVYLKRCCGQCTGISFLDATSLKVCHNRRISQHRVFECLAARGKTSVDWFFGFRLHLIFVRRRTADNVNERGELLNLQITPGNTDDRKPVPDLLKSLFGKVFADRGYVSASLAEKLLQEHGIEFFCQAATQYEKLSHAFNRQVIGTKTSDY